MEKRGGLWEEGDIGRDDSPAFRETYLPLALTSGHDASVRSALKFHGYLAVICAK
jgi:hypothetical protein